MSLNFRLETALLAAVVATFSAGCGGSADVIWSTDADPTINRPAGDTGIDSGLDSGNDSGSDSVADTGPETGDDSGVETGEDSGVDSGTDSDDTAVVDDTAAGRSFRVPGFGLFTMLRDWVVSRVEALLDQAA
jgi:hypothetical protein